MFYSIIQILTSQVKSFVMFCRVDPANEFYDGDRDNDKDNETLLDVWRIETLFSRRKSGVYPTWIYSSWQKSLCRQQHLIHYFIASSHITARLIDENYCHHVVCKSCNLVSRIAWKRVLTEVHECTNEVSVCTSL